MKVPDSSGVVGWGVVALWEWGTGVFDHKKLFLERNCFQIF